MKKHPISLVIALVGGLIFLASNARCQNDKYCRAEQGMACSEKL